MRSARKKRMATLVAGLCLLASLLFAGTIVAGCGSSNAATTASSQATATTAQATTTAGGAATSAAGGDSGTANGAPAAPPGDSSSSAVYPTKAAYTQSGDTKTVDGQTYTAAEDDQSGILVSDGGSLTVTNAKVDTTGNSSSLDSSSFYGLNAGVVATKGSTVQMSDSSITTTGSGANGAFATGEGASVSLSNVTIEATGQGGHGVMATQGGSVALNNVNITTAGTNSAPLATDRGGGTITATGGGATCSGKDSPALYSTGTLIVNGGTYKATGAEAAVIEGSNSITLTDVDLSSTLADKWGVMIYQSMSGDAQGAKGMFTMTGGSLAISGSNSPVFYVTNSTGNITLKGVQVTSASGVLLNAAQGSWGTSGSNGGTVNLIADGQSLTGSIVADSASAVTVNLANGSKLESAINADKTASAINVTIDASSTWTVTADSYLTTLTLSGGISGTSISNIIGNGHTVYYDSSNSANSALGGQTYTLIGGGTLKPIS